MKSKQVIVFGLVLGVSAFAGLAFASKPTPLAFPADWHSWQHVKSMVIPDRAHGLYGFHHVFVQQQALEAYKRGTGYPDGATLAVPFYEVVQADGATAQGALMKLAVMKRDPRATTTGGWVYGAFDAHGKPVALDAKAACHTCHEARKARDFVFSEWTE